MANTIPSGQLIKLLHDRLEKQANNTLKPWCSHLFLKGFTYCSPSLTLKGHFEAGIL